MSCRYNGVRANIQTVNPLAIFIPYFAHSLNLVGSSSVNCCPTAVKYFDFVQKVYTFFSTSTHRWPIFLVNLSKHVPVPKGLSDTSWSNHANATRALSKGYKDFCSVQIRMIMKRNQLQDTKLLVY